MLKGLIIRIISSSLTGVNNNVYGFLFFKNEDTEIELHGVISEARFLPMLVQK